MQLLELLFEAPVANVLIGAGVLVLLAGVLGKLPGLDRIDDRGRRAAWVVGPALILVGVVLVAGAAGGGTGTDDPEGFGDTLPPATEETTPARTPTTVREVEPNDRANGATLLPPAAVGVGTITPPSGGAETADTDQFRFWAEAGEAVIVELSRDGGFGTLYTVVYDPNGASEPSQSLVNDVTPVGGGGPVTVEFTPRQTGHHYVVVSGSFTFTDIDFVRFDGGHGDYTVRIETNTERSVAGMAATMDRSVRLDGR